jgi:hypothetical protein
MSYGSVQAKERHLSAPEHSLASHLGCRLGVAVLIDEPRHGIAPALTLNAPTKRPGYQI